MDIEPIVNASGVKAAVSAGNFAYIHIPTNSLRVFFDNLFPYFAKNSTADVAKGFAHRWVAGHDLLVDIPKTLSQKGVAEAAHQTGHILLTDFPTKAGIPIPGLSGSGLGDFLTQTCHIPKGFLCLNVMDTAVGVFAMTESTFDLINVISGQLRMTPELFFDTFVEGTAEIAAGGVCENPLLLIAGTENLAAGVISTFYTVTHPIWFVSPIDFFTGCLTGGIATLLISKFVLKKDTKSALADSVKSCVIGGLFAISTGFGIAGIIALLGCGLGKLIAEKDNKERQLYFKLSDEEFELMRSHTQSLFSEDSNKSLFGDKQVSVDFQVPQIKDLLEIPYQSLLSEGADNSSYANLLDAGDRSSAFLLT